MTNFEQLQQQLAQHLTSSITNTALQALEVRATPVLTASGLDSLLNALINSIPYYADATWSSAHRGALANLAETSMPNNGITAQPNDNGPWYAPYNTSYSYNGPYSGYRDAFFHTISQSKAASQIVAQTQVINGTMNTGWWGNYGVTLLTDAVHQIISVSIDSNKLSNDLSNNFNTFKPALAASYQVVFTNSYSPTASAFQAIVSSNQQTAAYQLLDSSIAAGQFTANINETVSMGGDQTTAATWFLFNLWIILKALGYPNVDQAITNYKNKGLAVPEEVGPNNWWNGGYSSWFIALNGSDVINDARSTITASMPESDMTIYPSAGGVPAIPAYGHSSASSGYSYSLCNWGSLNWYNPHSSSCFGRGTLVLMADGSTKPIESVSIGDSVQTHIGPRKVVLCEHPKRAGRSLYSINSLKLTTTATHPFLCADSDAKYAAIDPWSLIDGLPTTTPQGVVKLKIGVRLQGLQNNTTDHIQVESITEFTSDDKQNTECVYDLILENWEKDYPAYYVGGPDIFLAVESESIDPLREPAVSIAIITALTMLVPTSREILSEPAIQIPSLLKNVSLPQTTQLARKITKSYIAGRSYEKPSIPSPDFYLHKDEWDPHASMLEHYLVRDCGRWLRTEIYNGWHHLQDSNDGDLWVLDIYDIELINQPVIANQQLTISIDVENAPFVRPRPVVNKIIELPTKPTWCLRLDDTIELGQTPVHTNFVLTGKIASNDTTYGQFQIHANTRNSQKKFTDLFVFNQQGEVLGRIAVTLRTTTIAHRNTENQNKSQWNRSKMQAYAFALGSQLGTQLLSVIEANTDHI